MLYDLWRDVAAARANDFALDDFAAGRRWTFSQLFAAGEKLDLDDTAIVCPAGQAPEFILLLLAAWRQEKLVCPLETGQRPPEVPPPPGCAHLKSTSATAGTPRLVAFTGEQLAADAEHIVTAMGLRPDWPNLGAISLAHSYGFSNLVLPLLLHGIPLILVPAPLPDQVRRAAESAGAVTLPGVPALWRAWHEAGGIPPAVRLAISAGAPLPLELEQAVFAKSGVKIHNFYGASECGGIAYDAGARPRTEAADAGTLLPGVEAAVNEDNCLIVRGPSVGKTYWPEQLDTLQNGCFQSGDLAELSGRQVFLRGRLGDVINMAGRKVSPETIEQAILRHPAVRECLVFGTPSGDERTETIVAVVVGDASENELKQFLLEQLPGWQVPRRWQFVESLPTGPRGKISRADWRREITGQAPRRST